MRLFSAALALVVAYLPYVHSIFSDEAYQIDYHYALIGVPRSHATFFHRPQTASPAALLYTASRNGVVGAVNPKDGSGVWRQTLFHNLTEKSESFLAPGDGVVVTASRSGVTAWDALDGRLVWHSDETFKGEPQNVVKTPRDASQSTDFVALFRESHNVVRKIDGKTGNVLWKYTDSKYTCNPIPIS